MFCTNCGNKILENTRFCTSCGSEVKNLVPKPAPTIELKPKEIKKEEIKIENPPPSAPSPPKILPPAPVEVIKEPPIQNRPIPGELITLIINYASKGELSEQEIRLLKNEASFMSIEWSRVQSIINIELEKTLNKKNEEKKKQKKTKVRRIISNSIFTLIFLSVLSLFGFYIYSRVYLDKDYFWIVWEWAEDKSGVVKKPEIAIAVKYDYNKHNSFVTFWNDFKTAVVNGDSQAIYMMTKIPLEDKRDNKITKLACNTQSQFYSNFRKIFNEQTIEAIKTNKFRSWRYQDQGEDKIQKDEYLLEVSSIEEGINIAFVKVGGLFKVGYIPSNSPPQTINPLKKKIIPTTSNFKINNGNYLLVKGITVRLRQLPNINSAIVKELNTGDTCLVLNKGEMQLIDGNWDYW